MSSLRTFYELTEEEQKETVYNIGNKMPYNFNYEGFDKNEIMTSIAQVFQYTEDLTPFNMVSISPEMLQGMAIAYIAFIDNKQNDELLNEADIELSEKIKQEWANLFYSLFNKWNRELELKPEMFKEMAKHINEIKVNKE
jgi:hypothetical protein